MNPDKNEEIDNFVGGFRISADRTVAARRMLTGALRGRLENRL
jgi:hypothetical protein